MKASKCSPRKFTARVIAPKGAERAGSSGQSAHDHKARGLTNDLLDRRQLFRRCLSVAEDTDLSRRNSEFA